MKRAPIAPIFESPLRDWLDENGKSILDVARALNVAYGHMHKLAAGRSLPSLVLAFQLERITRGGVPAEAWLGTERAKKMLNHHHDVARWAARKLLSTKRWREKKLADAKKVRVKR